MIEQTALWVNNIINKITDYNKDKILKNMKMEV